MTDYVAGLLFSEDRNHVALVYKQKPAWQKNRWNAIGGKVEEGETIHAAMVREFKEETGVTDVKWEETVYMHGNNWSVTFFHAFGNPFACEHQEGEIEYPIVVSVSEALMSSQLIPNLKVIIPLALDTSGITKPVTFWDYS